MKTFITLVFILRHILKNFFRFSDNVEYFKKNKNFHFHFSWYVNQKESALFSITYWLTLFQRIWFFKCKYILNIRNFRRNGVNKNAIRERIIILFHSIDEDVNINIDEYSKYSSKISHSNVLHFSITYTLKLRKLSKLSNYLLAFANYLRSLL